MEAKEFQTRFKEVTLRTDDPKHMEGAVLAETAKRSWKEDFVDEDSGEVVTIDRSEVVMQKGHILTKEDVAQIMFHIQAGDIKNVLISNQLRTGVESESTHRYVVSVRNIDGDKFVLYIMGATSAGMAYQIATDYAEQRMKGLFCVSEVKENDCYLVQSTKKYKDNEHPSYYIVTVCTRFDMDDKPMKAKYLVFAVNADDASCIVQALRAKQREEDGVEPIDEKVIKIEPSQVDEIVPKDFCKEYIENKAANDYLMDGQRVSQAAI